MREHGIQVDATLQSAIERAAARGQAAITMIEGTSAMAVFAIADAVRPESRDAIERLHVQHIEVIMMTGDNERTAQAIAKAAGIEHVIAEVLPEGKAEEVINLQKAGKKVAMVGDGINDAPALAAADTGMAIGTGTDIAMEAADITLMRGDLNSIADAIYMSKLTIRNIKQNLFWAFFYNILLIPVAAGVLFPAFGVLLSPIFAAAAMAVSSVFVLTNALRLRGFKPPMQAEAEAPRSARPTAAAA